MKALFVGDIHNHSYMLMDIVKLDNQYNFDKIILFGDYIDDWNTDNRDSLQTLDEVLELKRTEPNKYVLLLGNHELSYLGYKCSGHMFELEDLVETKLKEHIDLFNFYTTVQCGDKEYVCTHAGITNGFAGLYLEGKNWKKVLNDMNADKLNNLELLSKCSYLRGGKDEFSSFVWADRREHSYYILQEQIIPYQIIGHTPVESITMSNGKIFIDTHSTYRDGSEFGDKSYLIWNDNIFEIVYGK